MDVNVLDVLLLGLLTLAVIGGMRVGFVARALTLVGLALGALVATRTVPFSLGLLETALPSARLLVGIGVLVLTIGVCTSMCGWIGRRLRSGLAATPLSGLDRVAGALTGAVLIIGALWFLLPAVSDVPGVVAREVRGSSIVTAVRVLTPPSPDLSRTLRSVVDSSRFPEVWADLRPAPHVGPPPGSVGLDADIIERATGSTVRVHASGCARRYDGSGVALEHDLVVTNAHVVAGANEVVVRRPDQVRRDATVVVFDADRDLAVLQVEELGQQPLSTAPGQLGADGVAIGYPGGQQTPRTAPARIEDRRPALGRDIYGDETFEREVLFLSAQLRQGDSGSPVIDQDGQVNGIVFAISPDRATTAYALDLSEVEAVLAAPRVPGDTGRCID